MFKIVLVYSFMFMNLFDYQWSKCEDFKTRIKIKKARYLVKKNAVILLK